MIPKTIHYCWFGKKEKSDLFYLCLESWHKYLPDYKIKEWNEETFAINEYPFAKGAYEAGKYAFVADVARLHALYSEGGIYMDTDVEITGNLDGLLNLKAFAGFESSGYFQSALIASEKGHPLIQELLRDYETRNFISEDGKFQMTPNSKLISDTLEKYGLKFNDTKQTVADFTVFPSEYFCPKSVYDEKIRLTENSLAIHHFERTWESKRTKLKVKLKLLVGPKTTRAIQKIKKLIVSRGTKE